MDKIRRASNGDKNEGFMGNLWTMSAYARTKPLSILFPLIVFFRLLYSLLFIAFPSGIQLRAASVCATELGHGRKQVPPRRFPVRSSAHCLSFDPQCYFLSEFVWYIEQLYVLCLSRCVDIKACV